MKRSRRLLLVIAVLLIGWLIFELQEDFLITSDGVFLRSELESRHVTGTRVPTSINFDLLDEAKPLDLIDMTLDFPESLRALDGQYVRLVGFMAPYDSLSDMRRCMIVPSYVGCTFCAPPSLTQVVYVRQKERANQEFPFIEPPSDVSGILRIAEGENLHEGHRDGFVFVIDEAIITPYAGTESPIRAPGHTSNSAADLASPHSIASQLEEITLEELANEVAELRELPALKPIQFTRISDERLVERVREEIVQSYPNKSKNSLLALFFLLGFIEIPDQNWEDLMTSISLSQRFTWIDEKGERIEVLDSASTTDSFTRLELVKEIADALARQHFSSARPPSDLHEDTSRAKEGIRQGNKQIVAFRYARERNISPASRPPVKLFAGLPDLGILPPALEYWHLLPWETGPFFVEARTGATKELSRIDELFHRPPRTTLELFRPILYEEETGRSKLISPDFATYILPEPPVFTGQLGIGGLVPWMISSLPVDQAKSITGQVLTDRYALWDLSEDGYTLLLETKWPDRVASRRFVENVPSHPLLFVRYDSSDPTSVQVIRAETQAGRQRLVSALSAQNR
ncbi:MAG: DUF3299 domain-containing protein [Verrucomicrobiota bacterium]